MCRFCQFFHFILKIYHNFRSYQNMLTILSFYFLYHKLQRYFVCHAHYSPFTCGKEIFLKLIFKNILDFVFKFLKIIIPYFFNCECFLNVGSRLLSSKFSYHQNYFVKIMFYLILGKINHNLT